MPDSGLPAFSQAEFAGRLGQELRRAGLDVTPERPVLFLDALRLLPPVDRTALYWAARLAFVTGREHIEPFDRVFDLLLGGGTAVGHHRPDPAPPSAVTGPAQPPAPSAARSAPGSPGGGIPSPAGDSGRHQDSPRRSDGLRPRLIASTAETLAHKHFDALDPDELAALERLLAALTLRAPLRMTRRRAPDPRGRRIDLRRTLRRCHRTAGDPVRLARSRPRPRPRRLVLLCDISGSMEPYTRAYLRLFPRAAADAHAEAFVFATRLTRLTPVLRRSGPGSGTDAALRRAGRTAPDWSGGTRIGHALADFNNRYGRRGLARGAVVVIFSDGWDSEAPAAVAREMARLRRLAHRIVWVNPRKASPGYAPLAGGMAAALPHCDAFVSGHSLAALAEVVEAIAGP